MERRTTPTGVEFGLWRTRPNKPAPTLIILSGTIEESLSTKYLHAGRILAAKGYLCASIDLPCHGTQTQRGRPTGLRGWAKRAAAGDDFIDEFNARLSTVVDHLIDNGLTDANRIASTGTSRGAFLALEYAAHDERMASAVGFCPVTDLTVLDEFRGAHSIPGADQLRLEALVDKLITCPVFIVIGDHDTRVDTDAAIRFARKLSDAAARAGLPGRTTLHVLPEPRGHATPEAAAHLAAQWIDDTLSAGVRGRT